MHGPIQALLELVEELIAETPKDVDSKTVLTEQSIRLLLDPTDLTASQLGLRQNDFPTVHDIKYISHLLTTAPPQHLLALLLGHNEAQKTLREVLTPVELSRVDQATYARLQILKRQSVSVSDALGRRLSATKENYRMMKATMKQFVKTAGVASVLDETARESLIALLWDDLVGVEDALNALEVEEAQREVRALMVKLDAILAKVLFVGCDVAGLKDCQFRWVVEMRGMGREVLGL
ncbi:hypothetical protein CLAFUW4_14669 [Fulvia fulva]|uniref:Uncharacterized protein n=1 Tax=Passalora fulva TaxID=5499 RepID=A0A9Q8UWH8_PASFU|nr:uncharacterized protein CLAFUR5_14497 [Fulvia fulva]KAK4609025.1 hypothetical protein CLAFUR4_14663 [Fulvia fulva]UJO25031.1 hypothetical protein CLAFUR5_14497 [Fulvia fulva]WPV22636.1 hypothetical protein CLAFUW4_14669 [Fulvia fulva]WPV37439.1 hypothetical protein CLAFUW7_14672 [Fulvia fulva]